HGERLAASPVRRSAGLGRRNLDLHAAPYNRASLREGLHRRSHGSPTRTAIHALRLDALHASALVRRDAAGRDAGRAAGDYPFRPQPEETFAGPETPEPSG